MQTISLNFSGNAYIQFYNTYSLDPLSLIPSSILEVLQNLGTPYDVLWDMLKPNNLATLRDDVSLISGYLEDTTTPVDAIVVVPRITHVSIEAYKLPVCDMIAQKLKNLGIKNVYYTGVYRLFGMKETSQHLQFAKLCLYMDVLRFNPKYIIGMGAPFLHMLHGKNYKFSANGNKLEKINKSLVITIPDVINIEDSKNYYTLQLYLNHMEKAITKQYKYKFDVKFITQASDLDKIPIIPGNICSMDCEWHGYADQMFNDPMNNYLICIQYAPTTDVAYVLVLNDGKPKLTYDVCREFLVRLVKNKVRIVGHNFVADLLWLARLYPEIIYRFHADTMIMAHVINENYPLSLDTLRVGFTDVGAYEHRIYETIKKHKIKVDNGYGGIPFDVLGYYAGYDVITTYRLYNALISKLDDKSKSIYGIVHKALFGIHEMMSTGMKINTELANKLSNFYTQELQQTEAQLKQWVKNYAKSIAPEVKAKKELLDDYHSIRKQYNKEVKHYKNLLKVESILTSLQISNPQDYKERFSKLYPHINPDTLSDFIKRKAAELENYKTQLENHPAKGFLDKQKSYAVLEEISTDFNPRSALHASKLLYDVFNLPVLIKTPAGLPSTNAMAIKLLYNAVSDKVIKDFLDLFLKFRLLDHMVSCFAGSNQSKGLLSHIRGGRIYTTILPTQETGRYRSIKPNLMQIPKAVEKRISKYYSDFTPIRNIFVADEGYKILSADYSQAELFVTAAVSGDKNMQEILFSGRDLHSEMAHKIFKPQVTAEIAANENLKAGELLPVEYVKKYYPEYRLICKTINFGMIYGRGVDSIYTSLLAEGLSITREDVEKAYNTFFLMFPDVKKFEEETKAFLDKYGYVENVYGRRRRFTPNIQYSNSHYREAVNFMIQSVVAETLSIAISKLVAYKYKHKLWDRYKILLSIHDQIILEVKDDFVEEAKEILKKCMCFPIPKINLTLNIDMTITDYWVTD